MRAMDHRADVHEDGSVSIFSDLPGVLEIMAITDGSANPVTDSLPLTADEADNMREQMKSGSFKFDHHKRKLVFKAHGLIS
jgi:hypothetical protein